MAELGAALAAEQESSILFKARPLEESVITITLILNNTAAGSGGGIYVSDSNLYFGMETFIMYNEASRFGGGIHAVDSTVTIDSTVHIDGNLAERGGGISLANATINDAGRVQPRIDFASNRADYGGAIYVDDDSENNVCSSDPSVQMYSNSSGCFFRNVTQDLRISFENNYASRRGANLFGGLLDRCTAFLSTNTATTSPRGTIHFENITNIGNVSTISSKPIRMCRCRNSKPDCTVQTETVQVKRGNRFTIQIAAVDQVNQAVAATIFSNFEELSLPESQAVRRVDASCTDLEYLVSFPSVSEEYILTIYADGPCDDKGISKLDISVYVLTCSCARGFMPANINTECVCICDNRISTYIKDCNSSTDSVVREGKFWITYLNDTDEENSNPYLIYPYCPLDYCLPPSQSVPINLNIANGSDAQCANNRGGILCGSCLPDFSLSLGGSKCIKCPNNWYGLLVGIIIAAAISGIVLVVFVLWLNLTVAIGTLNSIIFYANIINANSSIYFSQSHLTFLPVFVSWLNLNIGFDTCFFEGMTVYGKTWIQIAFPVYIIILVLIIIFVSSYSSKFSNLLGKRNPVATLATLVLLSYTKLLETIISTFSFVPLKYPNGTVVIKWLPDATIQYGELKHIFLIFAAIVILILGLLYTTLIFSWQWLLHCPRKTIFKWTTNQKLHSFIDTYHTPHNAKHRYWTGFLLLVRIIVYLMSAFSVSVDPRVTLLSTVFIMCCLLTYKTVLKSRVFKNRMLNIMESLVYFNTAIFASVTWYTFDDSGNRHKEIFQIVTTYISVGSILTLFLIVIMFHVYRYGSSRVYSMGQKTNIGRRMKQQMSQDENRERWNPTDSDVYSLFDVLDSPRDGNGYNPPNVRLQEGLTSTAISFNSSIDSTASELRSEEHEKHSALQLQNVLNSKINTEARPRSATQTSKKNSMVKTEFQLTKKSVPRSFSFSTSLDDSSRVPLLEEDNL